MSGNLLGIKNCKHSSKTAIKNITISKLTNNLKDKLGMKILIINIPSIKNSIK
tara:strand:+ start:220 stop:378 length:159 start_codon:yes stop_codon:yes gene_type:complete